MGKVLRRLVMRSALAAMMAVGIVPLAGQAYSPARGADGKPPGVPRATYMPYPFQILQSGSAMTFVYEYAGAVLADVKEDQQVLQTIVDRVGKGGVDLKQATAWLAEKASRLKLRRDDPDGLGTLEALETLTLGIAGKLGLWRVLAVLAETADRLRGNDFNKLMARAQDQHSRMEERRMQTARRAFTAVPK